MKREISENLVAVIRERIVDTLQSRVAAECLMALADRGVFTHRELPQVAIELTQRVPNLSSVVGATIDTFAQAAGLPQGGHEYE
jgi:phage-related minor tail protein